MIGHRSIVIDSNQRRYSITQTRKESAVDGLSPAAGALSRVKGTGQVTKLAAQIAQSAARMIAPSALIARSFNIQNSNIAHTASVAA